VSARPDGSPETPAPTTVDAAGADGGGPEAFPRAYARTRRFTVGVPRNITVLDENRVLFLRSRNGTDPVLCLWRIDVDAGEEVLLVDPADLDTDDGDLSPAERAQRERARESAGGIVGYAVDRAGARACFGLAGNLFVVDLESGRVTAPPTIGPVFDPRLNPDGSLVAYISGDDVRVVDLDGPGGDRALTPSGPSGEPPTAGPVEGSVSWGRAEFIAAEEMQRSRGYWWSPAGDRLLVTRVDESQVTRWWIADPAHPDRPPNEIRYPVAGSANARVELWLFDLDGRAQPVDWDEQGRYEYLANVVWTGDDDPLVVRQTRQQREVSIASIDLDGLTVADRHAMIDDVWVELVPGSPTPCGHGLLTIEDLSPTPDDPDPTGPGRRALLLDGWPLTGEGLQVRSIVGVAGDVAVVTASTEPTEIHVHALDLAGNADPVRLTTEPGVHAAVMGGAAGDGAGVGRSGGRVVVALTSARPGSDRVEVALRPLDLAGGGDGATGRAPTLGEPLATIADLSQRPPIAAVPTFLQLGPYRLESALFLPSGYDGSSRLPVLLDPYGGPHSQRVLKNQTPHLVSQWFAEQGFAVLVTDGRGTPGRGPAWERQVWGDLAGPVLEDQLEALDAAADEFDLLDLDRVGIRGWSFGGYLAALAVLRRPDRFHAAVAGAPVTTWRLYDTHYTERYLGRPDLHPLHYETTDLTAEADRLVRPLLLIHGLADDNVVAAHTLRLSMALLGAAAPHRVLALSGVTHMTPQETVAENLLWLQLDFLREALGLTTDVSAPGAAGPTGT
jgi:dipeptidyl-peptidase-4